ncbi:MAG: hypothetical protein DWQ47_02850 [Acidobacteria bacterium]|nr:MAG: hypothetical protein DWQ32_06400 [Acidobacteriota bacterium]REK01346.1 MAG: hypothetical protein DWQ38_02835 [Acidobacteriota bacterium]REK14302.1 MAG: hypothetical protein DWQ43_12090 [Acidobacteriota bacterium]REK45017.1 MAG: hypothetical protein DWQ47_02850 [Acidobacteriota bacterium]
MPRFVKPDLRDLSPFENWLGVAPVKVRRTIGVVIYGKNTRSVAECPGFEESRLVQVPEGWTFAAGSSDQLRPL